MIYRKAIPGFEGRYEASTEGRIFSIGRVQIRRNGSRFTVRPKEINGRRHPNGYLMVTLSLDGKQTDHLVHRLVALAFLGEPPKCRPQVAHYDGNKRNNSLPNLRYVDCQENAEDGRRLGEMKTGELCHFAKLTEEQVRWIRSATGTQNAIAEQFGVSDSLIGLIKRRVIWKHL